MAFGVAPAWITSHSDPAEALRGVGRTTRDRSLWQKSLVILQISLSVVLLIGAGLVTQTLRKLENQNFGFETQGRLVVNVDPSLSGYKPEKLYGLYQQLRERLPRIPGVLSASYSLYSPMSGNNWSEDISVEGHQATEKFEASWDRIGPQYFETVGTGLLRGRTIGEEDTPHGAWRGPQDRAQAGVAGSIDTARHRIGNWNSGGAGQQPVAGQPALWGEDVRSSCACAGSFCARKLRPVSGIHPCTAGGLD
jgi:hypothetical protein